jgi:hypothetical protein
MKLEGQFSSVRARRSFRSRRSPSRRIFPSQIRPILQVVRPNPSGINSSENFSTSRILLIRMDFNSTRINTSGNKDLKSNYFNTSGAKDLKSRRINTSKKQGRGGVGGRRRKLRRGPSAAVGMTTLGAKAKATERRGPSAAVGMTTLGTKAKATERRGPSAAVGMTTLGKGKGKGDGEVPPLRSG